MPNTFSENLLLEDRYLVLKFIKESWTIETFYLWFINNINTDEITETFDEKEIEGVEKKLIDLYSLYEKFFNIQINRISAINNSEIIFMKYLIYKIKNKNIYINNLSDDNDLITNLFVDRNYNLIFLK